MADARIIVGLVGSNTGDAFARVDNQDDAGNVATNVGSNLTRLFADNPAFDHLTDIAFDLESGFFFAVDSFYTDTNRIIRGNIADLTNGTVSPTFTTVFSTDGLNNGAGPFVSGEGIVGIEIDAVNNKIYWMDGAFTGEFEGGFQLWEANYDGSGQRLVQTVDTENVENASPFAFPGGVGDFAIYNGFAYVAHSLSGIDGLGNATVYQNHILQINLATGAVVILGVGSDADPNFEPGRLSAAEGQIIGIDVDQRNGDIYFITQPISSTDHGGIFKYVIGTDTLTELWEQPTPAAHSTRQTFPINNMTHIEFDEVGNRYYVTSDSNSNAAEADAAIYIGNPAGGAPTEFARFFLAAPNDSAPRGMEIDYAPETTVTGAGSTYVEQAASPVAVITDAVVVDPEQTLLRGATVSITAGFMSGVDQLTFTPSGGITGSYDGTTGVLTLSGLASEAAYETVLESVRFSATGDNPTNFGLSPTRTISFATFDGLIYGDPSTTTIAITAVNDAPVITAPTSASMNEDAVGGLSITGISYADPDANPATQDVNIAVFALGSLGTIFIRDDVVGGLTASDITYQTGSEGQFATINGTLNQINTTFAASGGVKFMPNADYNGVATVRITGNDLGNTGIPGAVGATTKDVTITINSVVDIANDAATTNEDAAVNVLVFANDTFEATDEAITGFTQGSKGTVTLNDNGTAGNTADDFLVYTPNADFNGSDSFTYKVTSGGVDETATVNITINAVADIVADTKTVLEDAATTKIDVLANDTFEGVEAITFVGGADKGGTVTINDNGTAGDTTDDFIDYTPFANFNGTETFTYKVTSGGVVEQATVTVTVTPVDDPSVITSNGGGATAAISYAENGTGAVTTVTASDPDGAAPPQTYSIVGGADAAKFDIDASTGVLTFKASPDFETPGDADANNTYVVIVQADQAGSGPDTQEITVTVTDVATTLTISPASIVQNEGDAAPVAYTYTVNRAGDMTGTVSANYAVTGSGGAPADGQDFVGGVLPSGVVTLTQSDGASKTFDINVAGDLKVEPDEQFTVTLTGAAKAVLGATTSAIGTIVNTDVNQPPTLTPTPGGVTTAEQNLVVVDAAIDVADPDSALFYGATVKITGGFDSGDDLLSLSGTFGDLTGVYSNLTGVLTLTSVGGITEAQMEAALRAVQFATQTDAPSTAQRTVSFTVNDGTVDSAAVTRTVDVTAVNDAPVNTVPLGPLTFYKLQANAINGLSIADPDQPSSEIYTVTLSADHGGLSIVDETGLTVTGEGTHSLKLEGALAAIKAALELANNVKYTPDAGYLGPDTLTLLTSDGGAIGSGGILTDQDTVSITVNDVNDAPAGTNGVLSLTEDTPYTLTAANFGFTDPGDSPPDALLSVVITTLPTLGVLRLNGVAVTPGQDVSVANINAGLLVYTPPLDGNGAALSSFTFQVRDDGGTTNGGIDLDPSANTLTINVAAVNDAPVVSVSAAGVFTELTGPDTGANAVAFTGPGTNLSDVDSATLANLKVAIAASTVAAGDQLRIGATVIDITGAAASGEVTAGGTVFRYAIADASGVRTLTFQSLTGAGGAATPAAIAAYEALLDGLRYNNTSDNPVDGSTRSFAVTVNDGALDSAPDVFLVTLSATNDAPAGANGSANVEVNTPYVLTAANFGFTDVDGDVLQSVFIDSFAGSGALTLNGAPVTPGQEIAVASINAGQLRYTPPAGASGANLASFTFRVRDDGGTANGGIDTDPSANSFAFNVIDNTPPLLVSTSPADEQGNIAPQANLVLTFNEAVKAGSGALQLYEVVNKTTAVLVTTILVTDVNQVSFSGSTMTVDPTANLQPGREYYLTFGSGVVVDLAGNAFAGLSSTQMNFFTAAPDTAAPVLVSSSPADDATGVNPAANLVLTFNEQVQAGTGSFEIWKLDPKFGAVLFRTIAAGDATQVSVSGASVTLNPTVDLDPSSSYYVNFTAGAVRDLAGNNAAALTSQSAYNFSTGLAAPLPTLAIGPANITLAEGNGGTTAYSFTVTRTGDTSGATTANWAVTGSSANPANAADFGGTLPSGVVSFVAGQTTATLTVNVAGDTAFEPTEGFTVTLSGASGSAVIATASATGTITNDDAGPPSLAIGPANLAQNEGNAGTTAFTFTVTRSGDVSGTSSANWAVSGSSGNAANVFDFATAEVFPSGTVTFAAGATTATIVVNVLGDTAFEPTEGFTVTLSSPSAGTTISTASATGTIVNDDTNPSDTTAPLLVSSSPADEQGNIAPQANLVLTFNEAVQAGSGVLQIYDNTDRFAAPVLVRTISVTDAGQVSFSGSTLTINPTADLSPSRAYYLTFGSGVVVDLAGNAFAGLSSTQMNFFTAAPDTAAPVLVSSSPADDATGVNPAANLVLTFNEQVQAGTGSFEIWKLDPKFGAVLFRTIAAGDATQVSVSGASVTLNPTVDLDPSSSYYVNFTAGAVRDLAGNNAAALTSQSAYNFSTGSGVVVVFHESFAAPAFSDDAYSAPLIGTPDDTPPTMDWTGILWG